MTAQVKITARTRLADVAIPIDLLSKVIASTETIIVSIRRIGRDVQGRKRTCMVLDES